jgi:small subunit ribosomal protein S3
VDFGTAEARTTFGQIGVKVWVYHGDQVPHREQETERALARAHASAALADRPGRGTIGTAPAGGADRPGPVADGEPPALEPEATTTPEAPDPSELVTATVVDVAPEAVEVAATSGDPDPSPSPEGGES